MLVFLELGIHLHLIGGGGLHRVPCASCPSRSQSLLFDLVASTDVYSVPSQKGGKYQGRFVRFDERGISLRRTGWDRPSPFFHARKALHSKLLSHVSYGSLRGILIYLR